MSTFQWQDSYSVGIDAIDAQHKILIDLIDNLGKVESGNGDLRDVMDKLDWYVRKHFSLEESMMRDGNYPDLEAHMAEHRDFEKWLASAQSHMATGGLDMGILANTINDHLQEWLQHHILVVDMNYKGKLGG
ncbi:MAG: bacteriohemerythrin [Proteobacteria bacterium]|nr:bacteriohemerythrin [Pseudomonadota bacterium]